MTRINVIFHSVTGHTAKLASAIAEGVESLGGCTAVLKQIPELPGQGPVTMTNLPARQEAFAPASSWPLPWLAARAMARLNR